MYLVRVVVYCTYVPNVHAGTFVFCECVCAEMCVCLVRTMQMLLLAAQMCMHVCVCLRRVQAQI